MEENIQNQPEDITQDAIENSENISDLDLNEDYVINWDKNTEDDAVQNEETAEVSLGEQTESSQEVADEVRESEDGEHDVEVQEEDGAVELGQVWEDDDEEDTDISEEEYPDDAEDEIDDEEEGEDSELGEDWDKMLQFMEDYPGATPADYVKMTSGGEGMSDEEILKIQIASENGLDFEQDGEEIDFLFDDKFGYDEELDSERDIKLKKIASKKALREAKDTLSEAQLKYGADLKFGSESPEMKEALSFQQEQLDFQQQNEELALTFRSNTKDYFAKEFKGFEFEYGDGQSQRIKANGDKLADFQSDIGNFIEQFMGDDGSINDLEGYHKSLWAAQNADALFSHAYEQGKADAVRKAAKTAKNIDMNPRQDRSAESVTQQGKFRLVDEGQNTEDFKFNF